MKKIVLTLTAVLIFGWQGISFADTAVDSLIQKLKDKGILTDQDAAQLKGQIASEQQTSQAAQTTAFKSLLPDWLNSMKLSGDFRFRDQLQERKVPYPTTAGQTNPYNAHWNRARIRARLNFEDQINDKVKIVVGIATDGGTSRSNNYTLGGSKNSNTTSGTGITNQDDFGKPQLILNKAYAVYTPTNWMTVMAGKMDNPIWEPANSTFMWDPDITPEGGAIKLEKKINDYVTPFALGAVYDMHDLQTTAAQKTDIYMLASQAGIKGDLTEKVYYKLGATWYDISNPNRQFLNETLGSNTMTGALTAGTPASNRLMYSFNDVLVGGADIGINDPFGEMLPSPINIAQIGVFGDIADNVSNNSNTTFKNTQNKAWEIGGYAGNSAINGWGTWKLQSCYKVIERDSWLDSLPDDDFYSGYTDTKGFRTQLDIGLAKNVWFTMTWFHTNVFKYQSATDMQSLAAAGGGSATTTNTSAFSKSAPENLFQMDLNFKF